MASQPRSNRTPIRALLIDISGTLLVGLSPTPGAAHALATLRAAHIPFRLCSNTSKESGDAVHARMRAAGLDVRREELWTSVGALRTVLKALGVKRPYTLLSPSALDELECTDEPGESSRDYDAVVVGLAPTLLDYAHLNTAFRILVGEHRPRTQAAPASQTDPESTSTSNSSSDRGAQPHPRTHTPLIALHKARYIESPDHALSLGPGPFVHALEDAARTSATVVGKPTRAFFEAVLSDLDRDLEVEEAPESDPCEVPRDRGSGPLHPTPTPILPTRLRRWEGIAVIGDDVHADLGEGAIELGLWRVLVKTGKYRPGDEARTDALPPDQVCTSFAAFVEVLLEQYTSSS